jgi:hypothetical protein
MSRRTRGPRAVAVRTTRRPDFLTPLEYPRGRTECPRSGNSRVTGFRAGRLETPDGRVSGGAVCPARHEGTSGTVGEHAAPAAATGPTPCRTSHWDPRSESRDQMPTSTLLPPPELAADVPARARRRSLSVRRRQWPYDRLERRRKESPMSSLRVGLVPIIVGRSGPTV